MLISLFAEGYSGKVGKISKLLSLYICTSGFNEILSVVIEERFNWRENLVAELHTEMKWVLIIDKRESDILTLSTNRGSSCVEFFLYQWFSECTRFILCATAWILLLPTTAYLKKYQHYLKISRSLHLENRVMRKKY